MSFMKVFASSYSANYKPSDLEKDFWYALCISLEFYVNWNLLWIQFIVTFKCFEESVNANGEGKLI